MILGIDFDNTIVCYDDIFHRESVERGLIPSSLPRRKEAVRNYLRQEGKEDLWTELQGYVYGPGISGAEPFDGCLSFLHECKAAGIQTYIISHKTKHPYAGPNYDLHASAENWLSDKGFFNPETGLTREDVFFALSKQLKLDRIAEQQCDQFIDDLPEFLAEATFPARTERILFDPAGEHTLKTQFKKISSWTEAKDLILAARH